MTGPARNKFRKQPSGFRTAALVAVLLAVGAVVGYLLLSPALKKQSTMRETEPVHVTQGEPGVMAPKPVFPKSSAARLPLHKEQSDYPAPSPVPEPEKAGPAGSVAARLAIIIDDMGGNVPEARLLAAIKVPLTFSIIPGLHADTDVAAYAATQHIETMIHVPMQPKGWPKQRLETNGLLVTMGADELEERMSGFVHQFPEAVGVNNHMGSEFTEHEEKMAAVLQVLKKTNLFFIDSVTSPESSGMRVAQRLGLRTARRHVFLDNEQQRSYILGQLNQAVRLARKNGSAIAICHPHPETIATLASALPGLAGMGVQLVPVSQLVK